MTGSPQFAEHVSMPDKDLVSPLGDKLLSVILALCELIGMVGNALALRFFCCTQRKDMAAQLYIVICVVDIFTSIAAIPVTMSLWQNREPLLFNNPTFCATFIVVFGFLLKISMYLVLLLSVSRCIAITRPFYKVNKTAIRISSVLYGILLITREPILLNMGQVIEYSSDTAYCYSWVSGDKFTGFSKIMIVLDNVLTNLEVGIPSLVTFVAFMVCVVKLSGSQLPCAERSSEQNKAASITVSIFTGIFLLCNFPYFVITILNIITADVYEEYPGPIFRDPIVFWYSWPISEIGFTVLNGTLNPLLYYYRMSGFRLWLKSGQWSKTVHTPNLQRSRYGVRSPGLCRASLTEARNFTPRYSRDFSPSLGNGVTPRFNRVVSHQLAVTNTFQKPILHGVVEESVLEAMRARRT